jgi:hypothetical protein
MSAANRDLCKIRRDYVTAAGFVELDNYYRPPGSPRARQPWLATVWRKA